ncbi:MAG: aminotransferase class I/II-fold pyridoxal phosphate-dependent enzyme [Ramlibacter sp.]|nr:aminotransferase class I/II-fold pyridoxal phosphate-dependent enzyme [Ramlibacter sp.]
MSISWPARAHGGPDAQGVPQHDFSTNSNACGPCPDAMMAVQAADAARYPDASYTRLRALLATHHGVAPERVLLAASASEFIFRITGWAARVQAGPAAVAVPWHGYGDYAAAARAHGLAVAHDPSLARLVFACEPASPLGGAHAGLASLAEPGRPPSQVVLDCAYEPLRLSGAASLDAQGRDRVWQLWTPNKALGLTGVRAAYVIAPTGASEAARELDALCPSWPVGAHGLAMLQAWCLPAAQRWLAASLDTLRGWKTRQRALCESLGWLCRPSEANFFVAQPPPALPLDLLRAQGIKLRDGASFGLPGLVRLGVLPPASQDALARAVRALS